VKDRDHEKELIERELLELREECVRVVRLLAQRAKKRALGRDTANIVGDLGAAIVHLHVHTDGLDELLDRLD
jgi:hypothetical protein